jgi:hypothetical protein
MKRKKKRQEKQDKVNVDTQSVYLEKYFPLCASWEKSIDPRRLRKKGSQIYH